VLYLARKPRFVYFLFSVTFSNPNFFPGNSDYRFETGDSSSIVLNWRTRRFEEIWDLDCSEFLVLLPQILILRQNGFKNQALRR
jgi:hypothetical protein